MKLNDDCLDYDKLLWLDVGLLSNDINRQWGLIKNIFLVSNASTLNIILLNKCVHFARPLS